MIESFPLEWPQGYPRSDRPRRSSFQVSMAVARGDLLEELRLMRARNVIKHKGKELWQVLEDDLEYVRWMIEQGIEITNEAFQAFEKRKNRDPRW